MKKIFVSTVILAIYLIAAVGSESASSFTNYSSSNGYSSDAYSRPVSDNSTCYACGGRGYIMRNGVKETCVCGGTGKSTSFPEPKK